MTTTKSRGHGSATHGWLSSASYRTFQRLSKRANTQKLLRSPVLMLHLQTSSLVRGKASQRSLAEFTLLLLFLSYSILLFLFQYFCLLLLPPLEHLFSNLSSSPSPSFPFFLPLLPSSPSLFAPPPVVISFSI